jgi:hypothetical protein
MSYFMLDARGKYIVHDTYASTSLQIILLLKKRHENLNTNLQKIKPVSRKYNFDFFLKYFLFKNILK